MNKSNQLSGTCLVTGGAGFIGSNLVDYLINNGIEVIVIDNLSSGKLLNLRKSINKITFIKDDLESYDLESLDKIDYVIHLAAQASVPFSISNFKESSNINLQSSINIIDYCSKNNIPLIYASSSAIYGELPNGNDNSLVTNLISPYAADKYFLEVYSQISHKLHNLSSIGLRFFNVYGPRQDSLNPYSGVISIFADRILKAKEITINGGFQTRDFVYVSDVIGMIYKALNLVSNKPICKISNVLTGRSVTIDYLADEIISIVGASVSKNYSEMPTGDPLKSDGNTDNMVDLFKINIKSLIDLNDGLTKTIESIKNQE